MNKDEYLASKWGTKEWSYNLEIAYIYSHITRVGNPIHDALEECAKQLITANDILSRPYEEIDLDGDYEEVETEYGLIQDESGKVEDNIMRRVHEANNHMRYAVNGKNTRPYYYVNRNRQTKSNNVFLFQTLFKQYLLKRNSRILEDADYKKTLCFIEKGSDAIKKYINKDF